MFILDFYQDTSSLTLKHNRQNHYENRYLQFGVVATLLFDISFLEDSGDCISRARSPVLTMRFKRIVFILFC